MNVILFFYMNYKTTITTRLQSLTLGNMTFFKVHTIGMELLVPFDCWSTMKCYIHTKSHWCRIISSIRLFVNNEMRYL